MILHFWANASNFSLCSPVTAGILVLLRPFVEIEKEIKDLEEREMELMKELDASKSNNMILEIRREVETPTDIKKKNISFKKRLKRKTSK